MDITRVLQVTTVHRGGLATGVPDTMLEVEMEVVHPEEGEVETALIVEQEAVGMHLLMVVVHTVVVEHVMDVVVMKATMAPVVAVVELVMAMNVLVVVEPADRPGRGAAVAGVTVVELEGHPAEVEPAEVEPAGRGEGEEVPAELGEEEGEGEEETIAVILGTNPMMTLVEGEGEEVMGVMEVMGGMGATVKQVATVLTGGTDLEEPSIMQALW